MPRIFKNKSAPHKKKQNKKHTYLKVQVFKSDNCFKGTLSFCPSENQSPVYSSTDYTERAPTFWFKSRQVQPIRCLFWFIYNTVNGGGCVWWPRLVVSKVPIQGTRTAPSIADKIMTYITSLVSFPSPSNRYWMNQRKHRRGWRLLMAVVVLLLPPADMTAAISCSQYIWWVIYILI